MTPAAMDAYKARTERIEAAISLREADRVPFAPKLGTFVAESYGLNNYDFMKDVRNLAPCMKKFLSEFSPDLVWPIATYPLDACEILQTEYLRYPGIRHNLPLTSPFQVVDGTYMEDDEFDEFLQDPTYFLISKVFPRKNKSMAAISKIYPREIYDQTIMAELGAFGDPDVQDALRKLMLVGDIAVKRRSEMKFISDMVGDMGFPMRGGAILTPFDVYADSLRGFVQSLMDVIEYPDETLAVVERIDAMNTDRAVANAKARGDKSIFIPLHAGGDDFMSPDNYARFYWPWLKKLITKLVNAGITPMVFCEGKYNTKLEFLTDVPKGKVVYMFEQIDLKRAKGILGGTACICGNFPSTLLTMGSKQQIIDETKRILDIGAPGGGFIMDCSIILDTANLENFKVWQEATFEYGKY